MAQSVDDNSISEGDLIDVDSLHSLLSTSVSSDYTEFWVAGSLLDYGTDEYASVLSLEQTGEDVDYTIDFNWPEDFSTDFQSQERSRTRDSFLRAGLARHSNLDSVMEKLRMQDDVIIGIDTNVLWDCTLTSILLDEIYKEDFPNWILVAVPRLVMAETENAANNKFGGDHPRAGGPVYHGRIGHRALQEIMDIREPDSTRRGLSMITVGEMEQGAQVDRSNWKLDSLIRNQFQQFLEDISFHKGTFFLSQDRVNVMMSGTEGADGLYLQKPEIEEFRSGHMTTENLTKLLYELCLQFGRVAVRSPSGDELIELSIFWAGKQVSDWRESKMEVSSIEL